MQRFALVVPTLNAEPHLDALLPALAAQTERPSRTLFVDSSSDDDTAARVEAAGHTVTVIPREQFGHGRTRQWAADQLTDVDVVVYVTQDAVPLPEAFERIVRAFDDGAVGAAYGRQLPRAGAGPIEVFSRQYNYPADSHVRRLDDARSIGLKAAFLSNSFAAYRRSALEAIGGFPRDAFFGEDLIAGARMLQDGWSLAYVGDARATHSHDLTFREEYQRFLAAGRTHARFADDFRPFGRAEGSGSRFALAEIRFLLGRAPHLVPASVARSAAKYLGFRAGWRQDRREAAASAHLEETPAK